MGKWKRAGARVESEIRARKSREAVVSHAAERVSSPEPIRPSPAPSLPAVWRAPAIDLVTSTKQQISTWLVENHPDHRRLDDQGNKLIIEKRLMRSTRVFLVELVRDVLANET